MKKVFAIGAITGFLVSLITACAWYYAYTWGRTETAGGHILSKAISYAWPTSFFMIDADKLDLTTVVMFLISSIGNAILYGIVALFVYAVWCKLSTTVLSHTRKIDRGSRS